MYERYLVLLKKYNVTTAQVCRACGISQAAMSNWHRRGGNLSVKNLAKIAKYFNVPIEYFTEGNG